MWIPVIRPCVLGWQPRIVGPMVDCLEMWAPLLPVWIRDHLLEQLILPRLQREARHTEHLTMKTHSCSCKIFALFFTYITFLQIYKIWIFPFSVRWKPGTLWQTQFPSTPGSTLGFLYYSPAWSLCTRPLEVNCRMLCSVGIQVILQHDLSCNLGKMFLHLAHGKLLWWKTSFQS